MRQNGEQLSSLQSESGSRFERETEDEERHRAGLLPAGQVGAKHQQLVRASMLNYQLFHHIKSIKTEIVGGL